MVHFFFTFIVISSNVRNGVSLVKPATEVNDFAAFATKRCSWRCRPCCVTLEIHLSVTDWALRHMFYGPVSTR